MAIELSSETKQALVDEIKHFFRTERDEEIGDLQAGFLLDFVLETVGPSVYNQAVRDAQAKLQTAVAELDVTLYRPETSPSRR